MNGPEANVGERPEPRIIRFGAHGRKTIAHYQATGKTNFLNIAKKYADCAIREIGPNPGQVIVGTGHQITKWLYQKLYAVTGDKKYLDFARFCSISAEKPSLFRNTDRVIKTRSGAG